MGLTNGVAVVVDDDAVVVVDVDVDVNDVEIGGLRHNMSTCAWRGVMRVTRASTPDVISGWRGKAWTADVVADVDDDDDAGSLDPSGSTCITGFVIAAWLLCDFVFPSLTLLDARCTRPAREAQI